MRTAVYRGLCESCLEISHKMERFIVNSHSNIYTSTLKNCNTQTDKISHPAINLGGSISTIGSVDYEELSFNELNQPIINYDSNNENIKEIVESLVLSRFGGSFQNTLNRMSFRKSARRSNSSGIFSSSLNSPNYSSDSDEDIDCYRNESMEKFEESDCSVNTTNVSNLLSNHYLHNFLHPSCSDKEQFYYNIDDLVREIYEKSDESQSEKSPFTKFKEDIFRQSVQIGQILKTIDCIKNVPFDNRRLEAEVALLTSLHRLNLFRSHFLSPPSSSSKYELPASTVTINNIAILTNLPKMEGFNQYFIGIFSCGTDLIRTQAVRKCGQGNFINIKGPWIFKKFTTDFKINIKIYCLSVEKDKSVFRKYFQKRPNFVCQQPAFQMAPSMFEFLGQIDIVPSTLGCSNIRPLYRAPFTYAESWISIDSKACLNIEMNQSGFLNVAKVSSDSCPLWNRRWCLLDDTRLMFWNYPREQDFNHVPFDIIDLKKCRNFRVATRKECCRNRTLILQYCSGNENLSYFLAMESQEEFNTWKNCLNLIINTLENWQQLEVPLI